MGNEESREMTGDAPPVLSSNDIKGLARYIESEDCENIYVMAGAGISTSAGIPDFRSPGTGLYHNLQKLNLPRAEAVFDINYFRTNPIPFYTLAKDMNPEQFRPTITHSFFRLLHEKGLLGMCFTQNIDTLERRAGLPGHKIIEAHGSFAANSCIDCKSPYPDDKMKKAVETGDIAYCEQCGGLVKPDIVFFGEGLPPSFFQTAPRLSHADLLLVLGTSLTVMPFAGLTRLAPSTCPRVLINLDEAGDIGTRTNDVLALGKCDDIILELCEELGWKEELENLWAETEWMDQRPKEEISKEEEEELEEKVAKMTRDVEEKLNIQEAVKEVVEEQAAKVEVLPGPGPGISKVVEEGAAVPTREEPPKGDLLRHAEDKTAHLAPADAVEPWADETKPVVNALPDASVHSVIGTGPTAPAGPKSEAHPSAKPSQTTDDVQRSSL